MCYYVGRRAAYKRSCFCSNFVRFDFTNGWGEGGRVFIFHDGRGRTNKT